MSDRPPKSDALRAQAEQLRADLDAARPAPVRPARNLCRVDHSEWERLYARLEEDW